MTSSVLILSGGLDSCVSAYRAREFSPPCLALYFDYGQRAATPERNAAREIAQRLKVPFQAIKLPWLASLGQSALTNRERALPLLANDELDDKVRTTESAQAVWIPNRNGIFLNIAAAHAEERHAQWVVTGFNAEEAVTFPDNSAAFVEVATQFLSYSTLNKVQVVSYTQDWDKATIVRQGIEMDVPFDLVWSCYEADSIQCSQCESCLRSIRAYKEAGIWERMKERFA